MPDFKLQERPERRTARPLLFWLVPIVIGVIIIVGGVLLVLLLSLHTPASTTSGNSAQTASASVNGKSQSDVCRPSLPWDTILQSVAADLHLDVNQVASQLRAGKDIQDVAQARGITLDQLHTFELHALQTGGNRWVQLHCSTQQEINGRLQLYNNMTVAQLNQVFTDSFKSSSQ